MCNELDYITAETIGAAVAQARQTVDRQIGAGDRAAFGWRRAIDKAAVELLGAGRWRFNGSKLVITSRSSAGSFYTVTASGCDCPASGVCWHRAARRLVRNAAHIGMDRAGVMPAPPAPVALPARPDYAAILAACDELTG